MVKHSQENIVGRDKELDIFWLDNHFIQVPVHRETWNKTVIIFLFQQLRYLYLDRWSYTFCVASMVLLWYKLYSQTSNSIYTPSSYPWERFVAFAYASHCLQLESSTSVSISAGISSGSSKTCTARPSTVCHAMWQCISQTCTVTTKLAWNPFSWKVELRI